MATASAQQIRFAEPVDLTHTAQGAEFDAYGRRFSLALADNGRVLAQLPAQRKLQLQSYRLLRGTLDGQPGSWVRLTESPAGVEGAIWDGHDLYAVTSHALVADQLTTPLSAAPGQTVIYRLSDAQDLLPQDFCALGGDAVVARKQTPLDQYRVMVGEIQSVAAARVTRQIEIALIADSAFAASETADPTAAMLARLNIVEGIFSEQVGLLVMATDIRVQPANDDPFMSTDGATLLEQLGRFRSANPAVRARGLAHLMTGKNLDGTTAGIAYVNTACDAERGVSLSERMHGTTISALIMAHELGHNLGAPHDGEASGACAATGSGFIMAPMISGYATFSRCSIDVMQATLESASCVTPADYADAALTTVVNNLGTEGGVPFTLPFTVRSAGTRTADDVVFTVALPDSLGLAFDSASGEGASCSVSGLTATCNLGSVPAGEERALSARVRGSIAGSFAARARVSAANDRLTSNNSREIAVLMRSGVDAAVAVTTDAAEIAAGAPIAVYTDVRSLRALPVRNAVLSLNLNQAVSSASMPGANCVANSLSVTCNIAEIAAGAALRLTVTANTAAAGPLIASANVSVTGDGDLTNNNGNAQAWVQAARDVELTAGPAVVNLSVGGAYEIPFLVRSRGTQPTGDVALWVSSSSSSLHVELVDADGMACASAEVSRWRCELGSVAAGDARLVRMRVTGAGEATADISAMAEAAYDDYGSNNSADVQLRIDDRVDLAVVIAAGGAGVEDADIEGQVWVNSGGREAASGATLDVDLNLAGVLRAVSIHNGANCELLGPQRARCALPVMPRDAQLFVDYRAQFAEPGSYDVKFTLQAPGDTAPANDRLTRSVLVRPYNDIGVAGTLDLTGLIVGGTRETTFTVTTARRALAAGRFVAAHVLPAARVAAIRASAGTCRVDADAGGICDFTALPADSNVSVTVAWRAEGAGDRDMAVTVSTDGDVVSGNNKVAGRSEVLGATDVELRVAQSVAGTSGAMLEFPTISLVNGSDKARGTRLEVTLPAEVTLVTVSAANAICSGNVLLRCDFADLEPNSTSTVQLSLRAGVRGNFVSSLKLSSINDMNAANDARQVALAISADAGVAATSRSGGGGGRMEWLALILLAALAMRRRSRAGIPA